MEFLDHKKDDQRVIQYREKLLGTSPIVDASAYYWDTSLFLSLEGAVGYKDWSTLDLHEKAKLRAVVQLRNMAEILDRHRKEMAEERKKIFNGKSNKVDA